MTQKKSQPTSNSSNSTQLIHGIKFEGYADEQYFVDPCKFLLTTPGISLENGEYEDFGIPATILANYLRENGIIPEKCDLNSNLILDSLRQKLSQMQTLVAQIALFEKHIKQNSLLKDVLPTVYKNNEDQLQRLHNPSIMPRNA